MKINSERFCMHMQSLEFSKETWWPPRGDRIIYCKRRKTMLQKCNEYLPECSKGGCKQMLGLNTHSQGKKQ